MELVIEEFYKQPTSTINTVKMFFLRFPLTPLNLDDSGKLPMIY
jgi:hypothetical protein